MGRGLQCHVMPLGSAGAGIADISQHSVSH